MYLICKNPQSLLFKIKLHQYKTLEWTSFMTVKSDFTKSPFHPSEIDSTSPDLLATHLDYNPHTLTSESSGYTMINRFVRLSVFCRFICYIFTVVVTVFHVTRQFSTLFCWPFAFNPPKLHHCKGNCPYRRTGMAAERSEEYQPA